MPRRQKFCSGDSPDSLLTLPRPLAISERFRSLASIRSSTLAKRWLLTQSASAISERMTGSMILPEGLRGIGRTIRSWGTL